MSVPAKGSRGVIARTRTWYHPDNDTGSFVRIVSAAAPFDPALADDATDYDAQQDRDRSQRWFQPDTEVWTPLPNLTVASIDQQPLYGYDAQQDRDRSQRWFQPDTEVWTPIPNLTVAAVEQQPLYGEEQQQLRSLAQRWFAPDAAVEGLTPPAASFDPALADDATDYDAQQDRDRSQRWFQPDTEVWTPLPNLTVASIDQQPLYGYDAQQDRDLSQRWFQPDTEVWTPLPNLTVASIDQQPLYGYDAQQQQPTTQRWFAPDASVEGLVPPVAAVAPAPLAGLFGNGDETQQLRPFGHAAAPTWETGAEKLPATPPGEHGAPSVSNATALHHLLTWTDPAGGSSALASVRIYVSDTTSFADATLIATVAAGVQTYDYYYGDRQPSSGSRQRVWVFGVNAEGLVGSSPGYFSTSQDTLWAAESVNDAEQHIWTTAQRWFRPDDVDQPIFPSLPAVPTTASVPEQAPLWQEQPGQERSNAQFWFAPDESEWHPTATGTGPAPPTVTDAQILPAIQDAAIQEQGKAWQFSDVLLGIAEEAASVLVVDCFYDEVLASTPIWWGRLADSTSVLHDEIAAVNGSWIASPTLGAASLLAGDTNPAVTLNGTTQYGTVPHDAKFNFGANDFSLAILYKLTSSGQTLVWLMSKGTQFGFLIDSAGKLVLDNFSTKAAVSNASVNGDTNLHMALVTRSADVYHLYLDGAGLTLGTDTPTTFTASSGALTLGVENDLLGFLAATIDEAVIWDRVVTATEASRFWDARLVVCADTVAMNAVEWYDTQPFVSNAQRWYQPGDWDWHPTATGTGPAAAPPDVGDFGYDAQQDRSLVQRWFTPDASAEGFLPLAPVFDPSLVQFGYDAQQDRDLSQRWFTSEAEAAVIQPSAPVFDPSLVQFGYDAQQDRDLSQRWFTSDLPMEGLTTGTVTVATVPQQAGLWQDQSGQQDRSLAQRWIHPDDDWFAQFPTLPTVTPPTTDQLTGLWQEQPGQERSNAQFWYDRSIDPVDGVLSDWFMGGGAIVYRTPAVLIDATTGRVYLSIGGIFIVPAE